MYKIRFDYQTESGIPDCESCSIVLTRKQYNALPEISFENFDKSCTFCKKQFFEQIRNPTVSFPAVWVYNPAWQLEQPANFEDRYVHTLLNWVFVCLDATKDVWITFKYWDATTNADIIDYSSVDTCTPWHSDVYRLDSGCKEIVNRFF